MYNPGIRKRLETLRTFILYVCVLTTSALLSQELLSQDLKRGAGTNSIEYLKEDLILTTDRNLYITGEQVWFNLITINRITNAPTDLSRVVYVELLDKNKFPLKQLKVMVEGSSASSVFSIPDNISSGNYIIRAYTNWMQNWPVDEFCYKIISVVNPFEKVETMKLNPGSVPVNEINVTEASRDNEGISRRNDDEIKYLVKFNKPEYTSREMLQMEITATDKDGVPIKSNLSVSIAKSGLADVYEGAGLMPDRFPGAELVVSEKTEPEYLPELEGHLLSGNIIIKSTGEALKNAGISLSFVGKIARCQFTKTNENGEFYFVVKEPGISEIVIQPLDPEITGYYVDLKQSFNNNFSNYQPVPFYIDSSKIDWINNAIISMQIYNIYEPFRQKYPDRANTRIPDFFGKPENSILLSDYIELTTIREVVKEIIPNVYTIRQNGKYDFKLINDYRGEPFENKPLVLVDGVPIYDFEKVLNINSKDVEKADVINKRYFYSENVFDGILSFITIKGNLSAMEFDNSVFRQVYDACQTSKDFYSPDYSTDLLRGSHIPDYRNTLYWNPSIQTGPDGKASIELYTSDESAEYTIVIKGISEDGRVGSATATIKVK